MKRALICGITGQDGSYLAASLLRKGYAVCGASRDAQMASVRNLAALGIRDRVTLLSVSLTDFRSVLQALEVARPDEVYNLAGQSSVALSFEQPVETLESIATGTLNLLEAIRFTRAAVRLYNAGSSECFGDTGDAPADERTPFRPRSPYATAKAAAFWQAANYRDAYGIYACSGILFNHESPLRPERFVTQKIVAAACRIAAGDPGVLPLGNLSVSRDWGWAPEYVEAMHLMLQQDAPGDFVIATGESHSLEEFAAEAFSGVGLDWKRHVVADPALCRPADIRTGRGDPSLARERLGWSAGTLMKAVVRKMLDARLGTGQLPSTGRTSKIG